MEKWIDREADFAGLRKYPIVNAQQGNNLKRDNDGWLKLEGEEYTNKYFIQPAVGYMDLYFNRNYKTIGEQFKKDLKILHQV